MSIAIFFEFIILVTVLIINNTRHRITCLISIARQKRKMNQIHLPTAKVKNLFTVVLTNDKDDNSMCAPDLAPICYMFVVKF